MPIPFLCNFINGGTINPLSAWDQTVWSDFFLAVGYKGLFFFFFFVSQLSGRLLPTTLMWWGPHSSLFVLFVCTPAGGLCSCLKKEKQEARTGIKDAAECPCASVFTCLFWSFCLSLMEVSHFFSQKKSTTRAFLVSVHLTRIIEIDVNILYDIPSFS